MKKHTPPTTSPEIRLNSSQFDDTFSSPSFSAPPRLRAKALKPRAQLQLLLSLSLLLSLLALPLRAQVNGVIETTDGKRIQGQIRWLNASKRYMVMASRQGGGQYELPLDPAQVAKVNVPQPKELAPAIQALRAGRAAAAIPVLEKIVKDYTMLQWDEPAARALAQAHIAAKNYPAAAKACEVITAMKPEAAYAGDLAIVYWEALLKSNRTATLNDLLDEAIKKGGREASARALVMRGDVLMDRKQPRDALKDGYLRAVILYENIRAVHPEALFKAARAFEAMQQNSNAEKMRSQLRTRYPTSEFAKKL